MAAPLRRLAARDGWEGSLPARAALDALERAGVRSAEALLAHDAGDLARRVPGAAAEGVAELQAAADRLFAPRSTTAAALCDDVREESAIFGTGSDGLDSLLGGGLLTGEVYELVGPPGSGKSRLASLAAARVAATSDAAVVYIDTSASFSPERVLETRAAWEAAGEHVRSAEETLSSIRCVAAHTLPALITAVDGVRRMLDAQEWQFASALRVVVVDSLSSVVAPVLGGGLSDGHAMMWHAARSLKALACAHHVACLVTCHTVHGRADHGGAERPALGRSWAYAADTRVSLSADGRFGTLCKSNRSAVGARAELGPA